MNLLQLLEQSFREKAQQAVERLKPKPWMSPKPNQEKETKTLEPMNKLTLEILDVFLALVESRTVEIQKNEAAKNQDYEKAIEWRTKENEINDRLPKWADLERMRSELNESINQEKNLK